MTSLRDAREALYVAPPGEFVSRRKELSAQLKAAGDPAGAKLLAASPKPSAHAWVVNRLYADGALDAAFEAGAKSRSAQAALMRGELDHASAKRAQDAHRAALAAAVTRATPWLQSAGLAPGPALSTKVSSLALAVTLRGSFAPYERGCLAGDVEPPSLEELASGLVSSTDAPVAAAPPATVHAPPALEDDAARLREARIADATHAWRAAVDAERAADEALAAAVGARDAAAGAVEAARAALQEREARARDCAAALADAEARARARQQEREAAAAALERARA